MRASTPIPLVPGLIVCLKDRSIPTIERKDNMLLEELVHSHYWYTGTCLASTADIYKASFKFCEINH